MKEVNSHLPKPEQKAQAFAEHRFSDTLRDAGIWTLTSLVGLAGCVAGPKKRDIQDEVLAALTPPTTVELNAETDPELSLDEQRLQDAIRELQEDKSSAHRNNSGNNSDHPFNLRFSAVAELGGYISPTDQAEMNARLFHNLSINWGEFEGLANFLHQYRGSSDEPYFGRYVFGIGHSDIPVQGIAVVENLNGDIAEPQPGIRFNMMPEKLFGWVDVTASDENSKLTMMIGRELPEIVDGLNSMMLYSRDHLFHEGKSTEYFELQMNQRLSGILGSDTNSSLLGAMEDGSIFFRVEVPDWDAARFVVGYSMSF